MPAMTTRETSPPAWVSISSRLRSRRMGCPHPIPVPVGDHDQLADVALVQEGALGAVEVREAEDAVQQRTDPPLLDVSDQAPEGGAGALRSEEHTSELQSRGH